MRIIFFLLILFFCSMEIYSQKTYIPDDAFEQELINLNLDIIFDDSVLTSSIDTVTSLYIPSSGIADLTGIEDFSSLTELFCFSNQIVELDLSNNSLLFEVNCSDNQLVDLDVRNGNNLGLWYFNSINNSSLMCIAVDNVAYANYTWLKDSHSTFSDNCNISSINELNTQEDILKITNMLGKEIDKNKVPKNTYLLYQYDNGVIEKRLFFR